MCYTLAILFIKPIPNKYKYELLIFFLITKLDL